ncbi:hypothetical protein CCB80_00365 [Armatimonadetes bacterium Uphvl-Ar1]|nr:hypothetical protein CCB80_00365 [Armatimonadetes bacterium Uphvl-Ar1]
MASVAQEQLVTITINDIELQVPKDELIVESVKRLGLEVPIFCYHPRMKPVGMCRMCLVEVGFKQPDGSVRKMPKPQAACTLPAGDNMVIYTDTEQIHKDRKGVLEFLLINHPSIAQSATGVENVPSKITLSPMALQPAASSKSKGTSQRRIPSANTSPSTSNAVSNAVAVSASLKKSAATLNSPSASEGPKCNPPLSNSPTLNPSSAETS